MIIFKHPEDIHSFLLIKNTAQLTTGFVPTMGALHSGHLGLVSRARKGNQLVICSIFVNPTQFNDPKDFEQYPATMEKDICLLEKAGCDLLFLPSVADIYPAGIKPTRNYELGSLEIVLEGKFRPGHFQGVCQVVNRLLDIVIPGKLYLGQKDFQQCLVLKKLVDLLGTGTQIIICPTQREPDGLAMSSRNLRLSEAERKTAPAIYKALFYIKQHIKTSNIGRLKERAIQYLTKEGFKVDYVDIANAATLESITVFDRKVPSVALAAVFLNDIRLIDNVILNEDA